MEAAGRRELPRGGPGQRARVDASAAAEQEELEVVKTFNWKPGKDIGDYVTEEERVILDEVEDVEFDAEDFENEDYSVPIDASHYEAEDWDKELAESECSNNPYDHLQRSAPLQKVTVLEDGLYDITSQLSSLPSSDSTLPSQELRPNLQEFPKPAMFSMTCPVSVPVLLPYPALPVVTHSGLP